MEKRVIRKSGDMDEVYVQKLAEEFKKSKEALAVIEKRTNDIKKELSDLVDNHGVDEDKLLGLAWNDEAVAEQVEQMYVVKEVWAFKA